MTPTRAIDRVETLRYTVARLLPGFVGVAATDRGLHRATLPQPTHDEALGLLRDELLSGAQRDEEALPPVVQLLERFYAGEMVDFAELPLDLGDRTGFQRQVLEAVRRIPRGEVRSYGEVAAGIGHRGAARAVGSVMASNPVSIVIPCHRVVASDGSLAGFGGGVEMKQALLALEGVGCAELRSR